MYSPAAARAAYLRDAEACGRKGRLFAWRGSLRPQGPSICVTQKKARFALGRDAEEGAGRVLVSL